MGRPKRYATPAARQAAYRQRLQQETVRVDRPRLVAAEARLEALYQAIVAARQTGHPVARQILHASLDTTLEALTAWFAAQGKEGTRE